ncbi:MAG: 3-hydroxyacyl-ACP dehydratase FabZ [Thermoleophilia bacterium]|jgi:3-hydroxyacyl-[acyl-carrier-protein] dehydratase|nr:3-hydroxyacyl-ACP dehydratase FabZ [Thermoleophilia bacterium]
MTALDRDAIQAIIPHRDPFLFVDEIVELEPGVRAHGRWIITGDEWFLQGHFPGNPIVPGVVMVEASAQVAAICALTHPDHQGKFGVFAGIDDVRFRRIVRPGDVLDMVIDVDRLRGRIGRVRATVTVGDEPAVEGVLTFGLLSEPPA